MENMIKELLAIALHENALPFDGPGAGTYLWSRLTEDAKDEWRYKAEQIGKGRYGD